MSERIPYWKKLQDPRWQRRRLAIFTRDGFTCRDCGAKEKTLHVHHFQYLPKVEPWDHPDELLITLCSDCHKERPDCEDPLKLVLGQWDGASLHDLACTLYQFHQLGFTAPEITILLHKVRITSRRVA